MNTEEFCGFLFNLGVTPTHEELKDYIKDLADENNLISIQSVCALVPEWSLKEGKL